MRIAKPILFGLVSMALAQQRFETGDLKGFTKSPTEHIIEQLDKQPLVRSVEGTVSSKSLARPLERVLIEIRGPGPIEKIRSTATDRNGRFRFHRIPDGEYTIKFTLDGFRSVAGTVSVHRRAKGSGPLSIEMLHGV